MYVKDHAYRDVPFSTETPQADFIIYDVVRNLCAKCEKHRDKIIKSRTVGMFVTKNGRFYIKEIQKIHDQSISSDQVPHIRVSLVYMHKLVTPPNIPYPVQIIGLLQWKCGPVIFAQIIEKICIYELNSFFRDIENLLFCGFEVWLRGRNAMNNVKEPLMVPVAMLLQETLNNIATKHVHRHFVDFNESRGEEDKT